LGRIGDSNAIPGLIAALDDSDLFARFATFTALNRVGRSDSGSWPAIATGLGNDNARIREGVGFAFSETYDLQLVRELCRIATEGSAGAASPGGALRETALRLAIPLQHRPGEWKGEWGAYHPALAPPPARTNIWEGTDLIQRTCVFALGDSIPAVRLLAIHGLRDADDRASVSTALRRQFGAETNEAVRVALIDVLGEFKDKDFAPALVQLLQAQHQNENTFSAAIRAASQIGTLEMTGSLVALVTVESLSTPQRIEVVTALGDLKTADALAALKPLVSANDRSLRLAAQRAVVKIGGKSALQIIRELLAASSAELRREAILALGQSHDRDAVPDLLAAWKVAETREAALTALTELNDLRAFDAYLDGLADPNPNVRKRCRSSLTAIRSDALPMIEARVQKLPSPAQDELRLVYHDDPAAKKGPLFANTKPLPDIEDYARFALETPGDPVAGERIFFDESGVACFKCHAVGGRGAAIGPDLTLIGVQFPRKDLIEHVLEPSKVVREGYQQWMIETRYGENYSGLIQSETAESVRLVGADGAAQSIPKKEIASRKASSLSLMPSGL